jgi:phage shock protein A
MSEQLAALCLADELDSVPETGADPDLIQEAAAELRRLHNEVDRLTQHILNQNKELDELIPMAERLEQENFSLRTKLGVRGYEIQIEDLKAEEKP